MDTIKCGRVTYELKIGDTIMDNGASLQLVSRKVGGHYGMGPPPKVSKKAFKEFVNNSRVEINPDHCYGPAITLYVYKGD